MKESRVEGGRRSRDIEERRESRRGTGAGLRVGVGVGVVVGVGVGVGVKVRVGVGEVVVMKSSSCSSDSDCLPLKQCRACLLSSVSSLHQPPCFRLSLAIPHESLAVLVGV
jgi:predicted metalloprotease